MELEKYKLDLIAVTHSCEWEVLNWMERCQKYRNRRSERYEGERERESEAEREGQRWRAEVRVGDVERSSDATIECGGF